jgi:hypothetical protein
MLKVLRRVGLLVGCLSFVSGYLIILVWLRCGNNVYRLDGAVMAWRKLLLDWILGGGEKWFGWRQNGVMKDMSNNNGNGNKVYFLRRWS